MVAEGARDAGNEKWPRGISSGDPILGMNIYLPAILRFTRGFQGFDPQPNGRTSKPSNWRFPFRGDQRLGFHHIPYLSHQQELVAVGKGMTKPNGIPGTWYVGIAISPRSESFIYFHPTVTAEEGKTRKLCNAKPRAGLVKLI